MMRIDKYICPPRDPLNSRKKNNPKRADPMRWNFCRHETKAEEEEKKNEQCAS